MKNRGFTLIELIVVVASMGVIMITVTTITINSFKARNRIESLTDMDRIGDVLLNSLKNNVYNSTKTGIACQLNPLSSGSTLTVTNVGDGGITKLVCYQNNKIASESANGNILLTTSDYIPDCFNFARCDTMPDNGYISRINFNFSLTKLNEAGTTPETSISKKFSSSVTVRN